MERRRYAHAAAAVVALTVVAGAVFGGVALRMPDDAAASSDRAATLARPDGLAVPDVLPAPTGPTPPSGEAAADRDRQADTSLPAASGRGRRVVFSESRQRVWLVEAGDRVTRSYLVSGSVYDNLDPGTYEVYSRSEQAWGIDDSGSMKYFVRFTRGANAAIGFHDIPVKDGKRVQRFSDLGTPLSHGCIRQRRADAIALWEFAPLGTTVVVTP